MTASLEHALEAALKCEGLAVAELHGLRDALRDAAARVVHERQRAEAWRLLSLRMLAVLGLDGPDGAPGPVLEGELLEQGRTIAAQAQRVPELERMLEQARQKGRGAGHNRRDAAAQGCDCSPR